MTDQPVPRPPTRSPGVAELHRQVRLLTTERDSLARQLTEARTELRAADVAAVAQRYGLRDLEDLELLAAVEDPDQREALASRIARPN